MIVSRGTQVQRVLLCLTMTLASLHLCYAGLPTPFNKEARNWADFAPMLQMLVYSLEAVEGMEPPPFNAAAKSYRLDIPSDIILETRDNRKITCIETIVLSADFKRVHTMEKRCEAARCYILCSFSPVDQKLFNFHSTEQQKAWLDLAQNWIAYYGGISTAVSFHQSLHQEIVSIECWKQHAPDVLAQLGLDSQEVRRNIDNLLPFTPVRDERCYQDKESNYYREHRPQLSKLLLSALQEQPHLYHQALSSPTLLACLGCGYGLDLDIAYRLLQENNIHALAYGIEIQPELVARGNTVFFGDRIVEGNALDAANLVRAKKLKEGLAPSTLTLVMAEGLLTRMVLQGPYVALQVLHQLIQENVADIVVAGGLAPLMFNNQIAEAAGWSPQTVMIFDYQDKPRPALALVRASPGDRMKAVHARSLERSGAGDFTTLDLSMAGLPLDGLGHFQQQEVAQGITGIDLSWSYLETGQMSQLLSLLLGFPKLEYVAFSGFESWFTGAVEKLTHVNRFKLIKRTDSLYEHELPTFEPERARLFGQYQEVPYETVYTPSAKAIPAPLPWVEDIAVSHLDAEVQSNYSAGLQAALGSAQLALQPVPADGACFYHALGNQLGLTESQLRAELLNHLGANEQSLSNTFPAIIGPQFQQLLQEIRQGAWGDLRVAALIAKIFQRRVIVFYPNSATGIVQVQVSNADGSGESSLPGDINDGDLFLIHNGQGHWLSAILNQEVGDLVTHNQGILSSHNSVGTPCLLEDRTEPIAWHSVSFALFVVSLLGSLNQKTHLTKK